MSCDKCGEVGYAGATSCPRCGSPYTASIATPTPSANLADDGNLTMRRSDLAAPLEASVSAPRSTPELMSETASDADPEPLLGATTAGSPSSVPPAAPDTAASIKASFDRAPMPVRVAVGLEIAVSTFIVSMQTWVIIVSMDAGIGAYQGLTLALLGSALQSFALVAFAVWTARQQLRGDRSASWSAIVLGGLVSAVVLVSGLISGPSGSVLFAIVLGVIPLTITLALLTPEARAYFRDDPTPAPISAAIVVASMMVVGTASIVVPFIAALAYLGPAGVPILTILASCAALVAGRNPLRDGNPAARIGYTVVFSCAAAAFLWQLSLSTAPTTIIISVVLVAAPLAAIGALWTSKSNAHFAP